MGVISVVELAKSFADRVDTVGVPALRSLEESGNHRVDTGHAEDAGGGSAPRFDLASHARYYQRDNFGHKRGVMRTIAGLALLLSLSALACERGASDDEAAQGTAAAAPSEAATVPRIIIEQPADGAEVDGRNVTIVLGAENIRLAPAGDTASGTGHHHLFVNQPITPPGDAIPAGVTTVVHLGKAQASHELTNLAPGEYTVIAVIGDLVHRRIDPQITDTVRFRVR